MNILNQTKLFYISYFNNKRSIFEMLAHHFGSVVRMCNNLIFIIAR